MDPKEKARISGELLELARGHRRVCGVTLGASAFVFLVSGGLALSWATGKPPEPPGTASAAVVISSRALVLAVASYLGYLLATVYRYNIRLAVHFAARGHALALATANPGELSELVASLDANTIRPDSLPLLKQAKLPTGGR